MLSVIIVTYNSGKTIRKCLETFQSSAEDHYLDIVVVDNDSKDETCRVITDMFPRVRLVRNPDNVGFARACNVGVQASRGDYLLFLNPDAYASRRAIDICSAYLDAEHDVGIVACRLVSDCGLEQPSWACFPKPFSLHPFDLSPESHVSQGHAVRDVDWLLGAFLMTRRSMYGRRVFDEDYFLYGEDMDLCYRIRQAGWRVVLTGVDAVQHDGQASWPVDRRRRVYAASCLFMRKHYGYVSSLLAGLMACPALLRGKRWRGWRTWATALALPVCAGVAAVRAHGAQGLRQEAETA